MKEGLSYAGGRDRILDVYDLGWFGGAYQRTNQRSPNVDDEVRYALQIVAGYRDLMSAVVP